MIKTLSEEMTARRDLIVQEITKKIAALTIRVNTSEWEKLATNAKLTRE